MRKTLKPAAMLWALAGLFAAGLSARADQVAADLSEYEIQISSSFTGTELILFGSIESPAPLTPLARNWDVIVEVRGKQVPVTVREKKRIAGIWVNWHSATFYNVPGFYYVASSRPLMEITTPTALVRHRVGTESWELIPDRSTLPQERLDAFEKAIIRKKREQGLIVEAPGGVTFRSQRLFRTRIEFPSTVPIGEYSVEIHLLKNGQFLDAQSLPLFVNKTGVERAIFEMAQDTPLFYGVLAVLIALAAGYLAWLPFRRK